MAHANERQTMDEAWARLESKLGGESPSPKWSEWANGNDAGTQQADPLPAQADAAGAQREATPAAPAYSEQSTGPRRKRKRLKPYIAATAAALVAVVIATPAANEVLASMLNKFRMQEVIIMQEHDLDRMMHQVFPEGESMEAINKFGSFEHIGGGNYEHFNSKEAVEKAIGAAITVPSAWQSQQSLSYSLSPSRTYVFTLNVPEINKAMKQLGANKLLPASVDGKPLSLQLNREFSVHYYVEAPKDADNTRRYAKYASYSRAAAPEIEFDPSINAQEAFDAVVNFPLLPGHIRDKIVRTSRLEEGKVPLPFVANEEMQRIELAGIPIYVQGTGLQDQYLSAIWLKDGYMYTANFSGYDKREEILSELAELVGA